MNKKIAITFVLTAASYRNKVVLFGGSYGAKLITYIFSREGELEEDLSQDPLIPGEMDQGSLSVENGKIFALGKYIVNGSEEEWALGAFDGTNCSLK